jgi:hypothetical protein
VFVKTVYRRSRRARRGQSMVEFALVLPLLLLITAGILEVGNMLTLYNRVSLAAREGARFMATGGDAADVVTIVEQSSAGGLYFDDQHTCIYVIHGQLNGSSPWAWASWTDAMVYPSSDPADCQADPDSEGNSGVDSGVVLQQIVDAPHGSAGLADLEVVVVAMRYNADTLLSLPIYPQLQGRVPIQAFTAMRLEATVEEAAGKPTDGCHAYPIAISDTATSFDDHTLYEAYQNEMFDLWRYEEPGDEEDEDLFTYLRWTNTPTAACYLSGSTSLDDRLLAKSLRSPGNSLPSQSADCSFVEPPVPSIPTCDPAAGTDTSLHADDCVRTNENPDNLALNEMADHICPTGNPSDCGNERALRVMVFDPEWSDLPGGYVRIEGFIIIRPIDVDTDHGTLTFEFVRWDHSCGKT